MMKKNISYKSVKYLPYVIHHTTGHVRTVTASGWNTTELHNVVVVAPEVKRRRAQSKVNSKVLMSSDNYVAHHSFQAVYQPLEDAATISNSLTPNSTDSVQFCDTDLNALLKNRQKTVVGRANVQFHFGQC